MVCIEGVNVARAIVGVANLEDARESCRKDLDAIVNAAIGLLRLNAVDVVSRESLNP